MEDNVIGALVGLACGDAVGTTLEFRPRGSFSQLTDMVGGGPFHLKAGQWTDDTSMALCLAHSLVFQNRFDPEDQMNRYCNWYNVGYMSSNGECFDIGNTVAAALNQYIQTKNPFSGAVEASSSGNGSIMRLAPIPIYYAHDYEACIKYAGESSRTTHGSFQCIEACKLFASLIRNAFIANSKEDVFSRATTYQSSYDLFIPISQGEFSAYNHQSIKGTGYVVDSLIAALWCFCHSDSYKECVLLAANLGDDADTTAAVAGQIAGAFYGFQGIPEEWRYKITQSQEIQELAVDLYNKGRLGANDKRVEIDE